MLTRGILGGWLAVLVASCGVDPPQECPGCGEAGVSGAPEGGASGAASGGSEAGSPVTHEGGAGDGGAGDGGAGDGGAGDGGAGDGGAGIMGGAGSNAGDGGVGGSADGAGGADGGEGGDAGEPSACYVNGECAAPEACVGTLEARVCVPRQAYCEADSWCPNSAGCEASRCLPPLPLDATCTSASQCETTAYCGAGKCTLRTLDYFEECAYGEDRCKAGLVCRWEWSGLSDRCLDREVGLYQHMCDVATPPFCIEGAWCDTGDPVGSVCLPRLEPGDVCDISEQCPIGYRCPGFLGTCISLPGEGEPCWSNACALEHFCGQDQLCHARLGGYGDDCTTFCKSGLVCAHAVADGQCSGGSP